MSDKLIKMSNRADILSLSAHLLCCGIPAIVAVVSFISTISLSGSALMVQMTEFSGTLHTAAFAFSTIMVVIAIATFFLSRNADCIKEGHCAHEPCAPKKTKNWRLMGISLSLYALNVIAFFFLDHIMPYAHVHAH